MGRIGANEFANITVKQEQMVPNFGVLRFNGALNCKKHYCNVAAKLKSWFEGDLQHDGSVAEDCGEERRRGFAACVEEPCSKSL